VLKRVLVFLTTLFPRSRRVSGAEIALIENANHILLLRDPEGQGRTLADFARRHTIRMETTSSVTDNASMFSATYD